MPLSFLALLEYVLSPFLNFFLFFSTHQHILCWKRTSRDCERSALASEGLSCESSDRAQAAVVIAAFWVKGSRSRSGRTCNRRTWLHEIVLMIGSTSLRGWHLAYPRSRIQLQSQQRTALLYSDPFSPPFGF